MQSGDRFFKEVQINLFLLLLYIMLYIIMAFIVWFDKKDGKGRRGGDSTAATQYADANGDGNYDPNKTFLDHFTE